MDFFIIWCVLAFKWPLFPGLYQGPVVQSVVSLTSLLRVISLTVLADSIYNILLFFAEKMWVAFKLLTFFQQKISAYLRITRCLGPVLQLVLSVDQQPQNISLYFTLVWFIFFGPLESLNYRKTVASQMVVFPNT